MPAPTIPVTLPILVTLQVNGHAHDLAIDPRTTLLDALREHLGLTGTKVGCNHGTCGACTIHVDGRRQLSCLMLAVASTGRDIVTIEGLRGADGELHPMQAAFVAHDALQCGYCTPGQIMSAVACVAEGHARSDDEIREYMSGNLCRCAAYPNIVAAVRDVAGAGAAGGAN
jgi:xanthine dehydrogenase YagT iron-sulfur-binding subunit